MLEKYDRGKIRPVNWYFLAKFIPPMELAVLRQNVRGEEGKWFSEMLESLELKIKAMPSIDDLREKDERQVKIGMHYFGGATDFWLYALDPDEMIAMGFVCLNGDTWNAEIGCVYVPEILEIPMMELDLYWNDEASLADIMKRVRERE